VLVLTLPFQSASNRALNPLYCLVNGHIEIGFDIFNQDILRLWKGDLNPTAFIFAAARPIDIEKTHRDFANIVTGPSKGKIQASFSMLAQTFGQLKSSCPNIDMHDAPLIVLVTESIVETKQTSNQTNISNQYIE